MLVLASASPRRRALLAEIGVDFVVDAAAIDESLPPGRAPAAAAAELARRKARAVAERRRDGRPVLAADTLVVSADGEVLGKPVDAADARRMLRRLSGTTQSVITGVCLLVLGTEYVDSVATRVTMRALSEDEIEDYVQSGEPFGKAGAYAIQETGDRFVTAVEGSHSNVVGLPVERVTELLHAAGLLTEGRT